MATRVAETAGWTGFRMLSRGVGLFAVVFAAACCTAILGSVVQTQINLAALADLGAAPSLPARAATTLEDLARFTPVMAAISFGAFLPAFAVAHLCSRFVAGRWRPAVFAAAGAVGLWAAFAALSLVTPMPSLVAATRGAFGYGLMSLTGLAGGLVFAWLTLRSRPPRRAVAAALVTPVAAAAVLLVLPKSREAVARADPSSIVVETVARGLDRPWSVAILPDGRLLVTELDGRLRVFALDGAPSEIALGGLPPIYLDGVGGLLEVAADPDFATNRLIYLTQAYGDRDANGTRLVRARLGEDRLEQVETLFASTLAAGYGHYGGRVAFLRDGTLALTLGDGMNFREEAQNLANHLGTVVRLTRDGEPAPGNPFLGRAGARPEIFSYGHRNPQGIAVDPADGTLLVSEHGPRGGDEINRIEAGGNYGWPLATGGIDYSFARVTPDVRTAGTVDPILEWTPSIAPAGLAVYDGSLFAGWAGDLLAPALKERSLRRVKRENGRIVGQEILLADRGERIRDVKVAPDGSIYVLTDGKGASLLRLTPSTASPKG